MITWKKGEQKQLSKHFSTKEFECSCKGCTTQYIEDSLLLKLELVREKYGKPIRVNSGYRCPAHNKAIGGAVNSTHSSGLGVDITPSLLTLDELDLLYEVCYNIFDNIGDGRKKNFVHVDDRPKKPTGKRHWLY